MGKGKRAREARAGKREEMKKAAIKQRRRQKITKALSIILTVVIVIGVVSTIAYSTIASTGFFMRNTVAMSSENYKVDNAMMTYYVKSIYYSMSDYFSSIIDSSKTLDSQEYGDGTWLDYFLGEAQDQTNDMLLSAEKAKEVGYELSEEGKTSIDDSVEAMKEDAKTNDVSFKTYLAKVYGEGINEKDVRRAMELSMLASEYQEKFYDEHGEYTDDQINTYFEENKTNYVKADYLTYTFESDNTDTEAAKAESKTFADKLAVCTTPDEFKSTLEAMLTDHFTSASTLENEEEKKTEVETNVQTEMDTVEASASYPSTDAEDQDELTKWLFADTTTAGMTLVVAPEEDETDYTVHMMVTPQYRNEDKAGTVRHIYFAGEDEETLAEAKTKADAVLAEYNAGEKTEAAFIALVKENSEAENVEETEGLLENVMNDGAGSYPDSFIEWSCDATRQPGDVAVVESELGYHVLYFVSAGEPTWKVLVESDHLDDDWSAHLEETAETFEITVNENKMKSIKA